MSRPNPVVLFGILTALLVVLGAAALLKGGFYIGKHEGDTLHLMEIVFRMAEGQRPHLDFMTPIGGLSFLPIVLFVKLGFGIGHSILLAQVLVAVVFLPAVWWVSLSRLTPGLAAIFGALVLVLALALVHGQAESHVSISMHYNRWAWAAAFVALMAAMLPPVHPKAPFADGLIIGVMATVRVMIKVTYFVAFAPVIVVALALTGQRRALVFATLTGLVLSVLLTIWLGVEFWFAYADDLLEVARSDTRANPGVDFGTVVGAPAYLGGSLVALVSVIFLRQARESTAGLLLLLLVPGFFYVTYQNYGNDPQWLGFLAILLLALRPATDITGPSGVNLRQGILVCAILAAGFITPSYLNMAYSPFRHLYLNAADYTAMLPRGGVNRDLFVDERKGLTALGRRPFAVAGETTATTDLTQQPDIFNGTEFDACGLDSGIVIAFDAISRDLEAAGFGGAKIFAADIFSSFWIYGDFDPLVNGSPWNYGGLPGFDSADLLLVPQCPIAGKLRTDILAELSERDETFAEVHRTANYVLYEIGRP